MSKNEGPKEMKLVDTSPLGGAYGHRAPGENRGHNVPLREGHAPVKMQAPPPPPPPKTAGAENVGRVKPGN
jgi:hypothetical protein